MTVSYSDNSFLQGPQLDATGVGGSAISLSPVSPVSPVETARQDEGCVPTARIAWDLRLHPKQLNAAYWREQASKYAKWDNQVAWFLMALVAMLSMKQISWTGWLYSLYVFAPAWIIQSAWILAMKSPGFYSRHRVPLVALVKVMLVYQTAHATNSIRDLLYMRGRGVTSKGSPGVELLFKTVLVSNIAHFPCMSVCLPLPLWLQLPCTVLLATVLFLGGSIRELVAFANIPEHLAAVEATNEVWARMVQSGLPTLIKLDSSLQDRSASMTLALIIIYTSATATTMYLVYISNWIELRGWIREKARSPPQAQPGSQSPRPVDIGGVALPRQQLLDMAHSPAAALLLDARGVLGRASLFCLHAGIFNTIFLVSLLLSQVLVLQVAPKVLPDPVLRMYFPLRPEVVGEVCRPEDEPLFMGWFGKILMALE